MGNLTIESLIISISGILIVFMILSTLCIMIPIISKIVLKTQKPAINTRVAPSTKPQQQDTKQTQTQKPQNTNGEIMLIDVDEKTAACIMAIISHETGIDLSKLIFKTIKAI